MGSTPQPSTSHPTKRGPRNDTTAATVAVAVWVAVTVRVFFYVDPEHVAGYMTGYTGMSTIIWPVVAVAFGWQRVAGAVAAKTDPNGADKWRE